MENCVIFLAKKSDSIWDIFDVEGKHVGTIRNNKCQCNAFIFMDWCIHLELITKNREPVKVSDIYKINETLNKYIKCDIKDCKVDGDSVLELWLTTKLPIVGIFDLFTNFGNYNIKVVSQ